MMEQGLSSLITNNWQKKVLAIFSGVILWLFVNHSITETRILTNVPIRVVNLPPDKTIVGLMPNGLMSKRITLTLSGSKDVIQELEPGDLEVVVDASSADSDDWIVHVAKKNLVSLNPAINLSHSITAVSHGEFVIHLSNLISAKVPVTVLTPSGEAPQGYLFLDIWPQRLFQQITGPEEEVEKIASQGLTMQLDLSAITKEDLDRLSGVQVVAKENNEISYMLPGQYKVVTLPLRDQVEEELNDPEAAFLQLNFLKLQWITLPQPVPVRVFYPVKFLEKLNNKTHPLTVQPPLLSQEGSVLYSKALLLWGVSKLFVDVIKNNIEISVVAAPPEERHQLHWSVDIVDAADMENSYAALVLANEATQKNITHAAPRRREVVLRKRFRKYLQQLTLYAREEQKLYLDCQVEEDRIVVR